VSNLDQAYVNQQLSEDAIRKSDLIDYHADDRISTAITFRNSNTQQRLNMLQEILNSLPNGQDAPTYQVYVPSPLNHAFVIDRVQIDIPDIVPAKNKSDKFRNLIQLLQFWANKFGHPGESPSSNSNLSKSFYVYRILVTPLFILDLLARAQLPAELYNIISKTEAAIIFALLTGKVIEPAYDPTADRQKWNIISTLSADDFQTLHTLYFVLEDHLPGLLRPTVFGTSIYISDPRIMVLVPYVQLESYFGNRGAGFLSYPWVGSLKARYPTPEAVTTAIGFNPVYYATNQLVIRVVDVAGYIIYKELGVPRPPLVYSVQTPEQINEIFEVAVWYNDDEVMSFYLPDFLTRKAAGTNTIRMTSRSNMVRTCGNIYIESDFRWQPKTEKVNCVNGDNISVMYGGKRNEDIEEATGAELRQNPIIWYGPETEEAKHRCFRAAELLEIFRNTLDDPDGASFPDPDYVAAGRGRPHVIDPLTGRRLLRTFNFEQMNILIDSFGRYMFRHGRVYNDEPTLISQIYDVVSRILLLRFPNEMRLNVRDNIVSINEIRETMDLHPEWKNDVLIFFGWLFMFSMWMRFWKGPGYPFNIDQVTTSPDKCPAIQRDEHIIIELSVYGNMITDLENTNVELTNFIKRLPMFGYDWRNRQAPQVGSRISVVINDIQNENYCMGFAGDTLFATAYVYLVQILNIPEGRMNDFMTYVVKLLSGRERAVIETRKRILEGTTTTDRSHGLWIQQGLETVRAHELLLHIGNPGYPALPNIDFTRVAYNMHV